jgi:ribosomal protein S18 acetylase RimI-like enzyme
MMAPSLPVTIVPMQAGQQQHCEAILRSLPDWFGIESSLVQYVADCSRYPTWLARVDDSSRGLSRDELPDGISGFITIHQHFARAAEIHCIAVHPAMHRRGVGRSLIEFAQDELRNNGIEFLQVKTLGPSQPDPHYELTRRFYESLGFVALEEFPTLWGRNPALQLLKKL